MSAGLFALLDDVAGIAKIAASSIDDVVGHAAKAGAKSAGVVIDDAAVTPRYVVGFAAEREIPIVAKIARGSLRNKLLYLLPAALLLAMFAPWAVTPLLMIGGAYLCYEGAEKVFEKLFPHKAHSHEAKLKPDSTDPQVLEDAKVAGAIRTDFILSAEIMAISLAALPEGNFWIRAVALAVVAVAITAGVYGAVALIVKADDAGVALARNESETIVGKFSRAFGAGLVRGMPVLLGLLAVIGTAAMIWVGGGIIIHGLEEFGYETLGHAIHHWAEEAGHALPAVGGFVEWFVSATAAGIFGLLFGFLMIPVAGRIIAPVLKRIRRRSGGNEEGSGHGSHEEH
jgi:predicted DNA repair protein MutK